MRNHLRAGICLLVACWSNSFLHVPSYGTRPAASASTTQLFENTKEAPTMPPLRDISYGEESRKYRRTVYSHDDWRKHRSPDRFFYYLRSIVNSGVYKNLSQEVATTTAVASFVVVYNALTGGATGLSGVDHDAWLSELPMVTLPLAAFTLSSPSLGLLLGTC